MNRFLSFGWSAAVLLAGTVLLAGCSRPVGSVTGKVTYLNKPLKGGSVSFVSGEGRPSVSAVIGEDGSYAIDQVAGGTYKVCVDTSYLKPQGGATGYPGGSGGAKGAVAGAPKGVPAKGPKAGDANVPEGYKPSSPADAASASNAKKYMEIPEKYRDSEKTDLSYTVNGGTQTFNIELK